MSLKNMAELLLILVLSMACGYLLIPLVLSTPVDPAIDLMSTSSRIKIWENIPSDNPAARLKCGKSDKLSDCGTKNGLAFGLSSKGGSSSNKVNQPKEIENRIQQVSEYNASKLSIAEDHAVGGFFIGLGTLSLLGNSCALAILYLQHKRLGPVEIFFVHQAVVDILFTLSNYLPVIVASFKHQWIFGEFGCTLYAFISHLLKVSSAFNIIAISIFGYWKVCTTPRDNEVTLWSSYKGIVLIDMGALIFAFLPLVGVGYYDVEPFGLDCSVNWIAQKLAHHIYMESVTAFCVVFPLFKILICHYRIIKKINASTAEMECSEFQSQNRKITGDKLTCIGVLVAVGYFITWVPITVVSLLSSHWGELIIPMDAALIIAILAKLFPVWNPLINIFSTKRYRYAFCRLLQKWICCNNSNELNYINDGMMDDDTDLSVWY